jgi:uncharacterized protein (TIGR02300 family)
MGRPELGTKCICADCSERFYDLNRVPAVCPKCGAVQPPPKPRMARPVRDNTADSRRPFRQPSPVAVVDDAPETDVPDADVADAEEDEGQDDAVEAEDDDVDIAAEIVPDHTKSSE